MKKYRIWLPLVALVIMFSGCIKDEVKQSYVFYRPVYKTKASVQAQIKGQEPTAVSEPGKIYYKDGYVFLNEMNKGIHIIDIHQVASPKAVAFVPIPGCVDMAVRDNILYADMYTDLVAINIANPENVQLVKVVAGVFPHRAYEGFSNDTNQIITDWVRVDTVVHSTDNIYGWGIREDRFYSVNFNSQSGNGSKAFGANGIGGSMARFALAGSRLYTVSYTDLKTFNVQNPANPSYVGVTNIGNGWTIETVFPFGNKLFVGSQSGMHILDISSPDKPLKTGEFQHARVCDPVVANSKYAYVTLRNGSQCGGFINQLDVVNIQNIYNPALVKSYNLTNPHGLGLDGNVLLICDGKDGLKIMDVSNATEVKQIGALPGYDMYDVIPLGFTAIIIAKDGLHLVDYTNPTQPFVTATIAVKPIK